MLELSAVQPPFMHVEHVKASYQLLLGRKQHFGAVCHRQQQLGSSAECENMPTCQVRCVELLA